jgi:hypothetical protein
LFCGREAHTVHAFLPSGFRSYAWLMTMRRVHRAAEEKRCGTSGRRSGVGLRHSRTSASGIIMLALSLVAASAASAGALPPNWPMPPSELERRFTREKFEVRKVEDAGGGKTGALRLELGFDDGKTVAVKWKAAPPALADGLNNSPRKELATYEIQRWIVDENDFIVPTVALHCFPLEQARAFESDPTPTLAGSSCVLGSLAVWMQEVAVPKTLYDEKRFESDPLYARYLADFNLLTYLVGHRDTRKGNVLRSTVAGDPRVYAVDNGLSFDRLPWNLRVTNWFRIHVPWLRRETVDRLRKVDKGMLRALGVLAELEADDKGVFRVVPSGPHFDPEGDRAVRRRGNRVQFGLDEDEIEDVEERIEDLLEDVDSGKQQVR